MQLQPQQPVATDFGSKEIHTRPRRSFSQSTIDAQLTNERLGAGAFKIVIDRPDTATRSEDSTKNAIPSLQVPIPHYRLGTPRFSAMGTAFFHQSLYARSSATGDQESSMVSGMEYESIFPRPPGIEAHAVISRRHSHSSHQPYSGQTRPAGNGSSSMTSQPSGLHHAKEPITPRIYDKLAANPHDPAIVKYSPINGDIVAASPARIIAQITSENFLDYELLSDFFLTVRSYLSTRDLLAYLLARFEWAISRFDDNGRVIRVRAFAALRHWILNYFSYDFVVDRDLRVQFCDRLNALTRIVKARANYGASDMKLIADLKKCWNGRCMLYWDSRAPQSETQQENDIQPGGILGSRDSQLVHQSQLHATLQSGAASSLTPNPAQVTAACTSVSNWYSTVVEHNERLAHGHARQTSTGTSRSLPTSPTSTQSIPALSCSIPSKNLKRMVPYANKTPGIQPAPVNSKGRRVCPAAPSSIANEPARLVQPHRRSGSFSDAARDKRAPLSSEVLSTATEHVQELSPDRSLLRGHVIPPGTPYINAVPSTPAGDLAKACFSLQQSRENEAPGNRKQPPSGNPAVKSLIGNIRRALSSKHSGSNTPSNGGPDGSASSLSAGKNATIPSNVMYHPSDTQMEAFRNQIRIDLLAAKVMDAFTQATNVEPGANPSSIGLASGNEREQPSPPGDQPSPPGEQLSSNDGRSKVFLRPPEMRRLASGVTDSSQSILIVDDTGLNLPDMSGFPRSSNSQSPAAPESATLPALDVTLQGEQGIHRVIPGLNVELPARSSSAPLPAVQPSETEAKAANKSMAPPARPELGPRKPSHGRTQSSSMSLRRYASLQSTFTKHVAGKRSDATTEPTESTHGPVKEAPARMLRRRPGGDLRANQNVQDLEMMPRPRSAGSITTYSESIRESGMLSFGDKLTKTFDPRKDSRDRKTEHLAPESEHHRPTVEKTPSLFKTHSSQQEQRRPSFEAAVAEFARIPDDEEGGLEATYLKLEGRYKTPVQSSAKFSDAQVEPPHGFEEEGMVKQKHPGEDMVETEPGSLPLNLSDSDPSSQDHHTPTLSNTGGLDVESRANIVSTLYSDSEDSYDSTPLLEREAEKSTSGNSKGKDKVHLRPPMSRDQMSSGEMISETSSMRRLKHGSAAPTATTDSFLLDENDDFLSDASSELSVETIGGESAVDQWVESQPTGHSENMVLIGQHHPPSPPMTMENALSITSQANQHQKDRKPPTPDPSPVTHHVEPNKPNNQSIPAPAPVPAPTLQQPRHMPYILGFESELLAQQFTIIEKEALKEIDWRDLVDMRWQTSGAPTQNWVEYLLSQDPLGIDLVSARFNIVVKWAISEVMLTESVEERALTIVKYIHTAQYARKIHNYATLMQLTIALSSTDCARLSKTWDAVPAAEKEILQDLEMLVSPRRNFHNLRMEMEKANADQGCIPVMGKYDQANSPQTFKTVDETADPCSTFSALRPRHNLQLAEARSVPRRRRRRDPRQLRALSQHRAHR